MAKIGRIPCPMQKKKYEKSFMNENLPSEKDNIFRPVIQ